MNDVIINLRETSRSVASVGRPSTYRHEVASGGSGGAYTLAMLWYYKKREKERKRGQSSEYYANTMRNR